MPLFRRKDRFEVPQDANAQTLNAMARLQADPVKKHALLHRAETIEPTDLPTKRALLMLGNLHKRNPRHIDFRVIKCYLLHAFEMPEQHPEEEISAFSRELFDHPLLQECLSLSAAPESFMREYLEELSSEYIRLFLAGNAQYVPSLFGFSRKTNLGRYLARPMSAIIANAFSSPFLSDQEQSLLAGSFYRACHRFLNGDTHALDQALGVELIKQLQ